MGWAKSHLFFSSLFSVFVGNSVSDDGVVSVPGGSFRLIVLLVLETLPFLDRTALSVVQMMVSVAVLVSCLFVILILLLMMLCKFTSFFKYCLLLQR